MQRLLPDIRKTAVFGKRIFLLSDLDVPLLDNGDIADDTRLQDALPTVRYLLEQRASVVVAGKIGRPNGTVVASLSLSPVAQWFFERALEQESQNKGISKQKVGTFDGWQITQTLFLLENLRFDPSEEANAEGFAKRLASLADIYVNDAFSLSHRSHASVVGVCRLLPHFAGLHLQDEIAALSGVLDNPKRPLVVVIGGKKIETKLPLIKKMADLADHVLVGGKLANEALSLVEKKQLDVTRGKAKVLIATQNQDGVDISTESLMQFLKIIPLAKTIVWNGPMGVTTPAAKGQQSDINASSEKGTREIAQAIVASSSYSVVGGGDTVEFLNSIGLLDRFGFVSSGGGAMLAYLSGDTLPGIASLLEG